MNRKIVMVAAVIAVVVAVIFVGIGASRGAQSSERLLSLGEKYLTELEYEQALAQFLKVIEIEPMTVRGYTGAADACIGLSRQEDAIAILEQGYEATGSIIIREKLDRLLAEQEPELKPEEPSEPGTEAAEDTSLPEEWLPEAPAYQSYYQEMREQLNDLLQCVTYAEAVRHMGAEWNEYVIMGGLCFAEYEDGDFLYRVLVQPGVAYDVNSGAPFPGEAVVRSVRVVTSNPQEMFDTDILTYQSLSEILGQAPPLPEQSQFAVVGEDDIVEYQIDGEIVTAVLDMSQSDYPVTKIYIEHETEIIESEPVLVADSRWKEAYQNIIKDTYLDMHWDIEYAMLDLDGDGAPELLLNSMPSARAPDITLYTVKDGTLQILLSYVGVRNFFNPQEGSLLARSQTNYDAIFSFSAYVTTVSGMDNLQTYQLHYSHPDPSGAMTQPDFSSSQSSYSYSDGDSLFGQTSEISADEWKELYDQLDFRNPIKMHIYSGAGFEGGLL